jgi:hypothetical protein
MNLARLMDNGTDPGYVRSELLCHFDAVTVLEEESNGRPNEPRRA